MKIFRNIISVTILIPLISLAQEPSDSTKAEAKEDSVQIVDSLKIDSLYDSGSSEAEKRFGDMQKRLDEYKESEKPLPRLSYCDSLVTYLASERFNRRANINQSFFHDAGDYFKFDPAFFVLDYQSTPMRKTVQPFGLTGDRLNIISNGQNYSPFEHIVEPDGLVDLNDIPTALDGPVYVIPGPAGQLFGGESNLATLLTVTAQADSNKPASTLMADKGFFGYAFVRGAYARKFSDGRRILLSASSRKSDGVAFGRNDNQGHYTLSAEMPLNKKLGFKINGSLYDREGALAVRPDIGGALLYRERFDRSIGLALDVSNDEFSNRTAIGYLHKRQGSNLDFGYKGRFDNTGNGFFVSHERMVGDRMFKAEVDGNFANYDNGFIKDNRFNSSLTLSTIALRTTQQISALAKVTYSDENDFLPSANLVYQSEFEKFFVQFALGLTTREPTLHQLHLPFQRRTLYGASTEEYSESGNSELIKETEMVGSFTIEPGTVDNNVSFNVTGGKITDAIEWSSELTTGAVDVRHFMPVNDDITFWTASVKPSFRIADNLRFTGGGAYFHYDYDSLGDRPYQPEYNLFTGLELHYYWAQRLVHLYAYGEVVYTGPYDGYDVQGLGEQLIANAKLSIGMKNFRFHFVFENTFDEVYQSRENLRKAGRFFYYGLVWNFFD